MHEPVNILLKDCIIDKVNRRIIKNNYKDLKKSINEVGLISPIVVYLEGTKFRVLCGRARVIACRKLGWLSLMACIIDKPKEPELIHLQESYIHKKVTKQELGRLVQKMLNQNVPIKEIAEKTGRSVSTLRRWLAYA